MNFAKPGINGTLRGPIVVAVEGRDYYYAISKHFELSPPFPKDLQLWDYKENGLSLSQGLKVLFELSAFTRGDIRSFGVITDAETDSDAAEKSIRSTLAKHKFPVPPKPMELARSNNKASSAYLVMPHGKDTGCLDSALLEACIAPKEHVDLVDEFVGKISAIQPPANPNLIDKRKVRSLIAGSAHPYRTVSHCVKSLWSFDRPSLKVILDFIELVMSDLHK